MKYIFIDTNIYLNFYHLTDDDIEELRKLLVAIQNRQLTLFITKQVIDEFTRNREAKIADALAIVEKYKLPSSYPRLVQGYEEFKLIKNAQRDYASNLKQLIEKVRADIESKSLAADALIKDLFTAATELQSSPEIIAKAKDRMAVGNPPRKNRDSSLGDAINWEILLESFTESEPLHFVSQDGDYASKVDNENLSEFLSMEWSEAKDAQISFYRYLSVFFAKNFPDIKLADELDKELCVKRLVDSSSYEETHACIAKLSKLVDFTDEQVVEICKAPLINGQVSRIIEDEDVYDFYSEIVRKYPNKIPEDNLSELHEMLAKEPETNFDDLPF